MPFDTIGLQDTLKLHGNSVHYSCTAITTSCEYLIAETLNEVRSLFVSIMHRHSLLMWCRSGVRQSTAWRWAFSVSSASSGRNHSGRSSISAQSGVRQTRPRDGSGQSRWFSIGTVRNAVRTVSCGWQKIRYHSQRRNSAAKRKGWRASDIACLLLLLEPFIDLI